MKTLYRIGQIVPSSNITMETEIPAMLQARQLIRPYALLRLLSLEQVVPGAGALLSGAY